MTTTSRTTRQSTNARRVFGCGVDSFLFERKYAALFQENQARLERVARRVGLTAKLRYEIGFRENPFRSREEDYLLRSVELSSVEVYLLCTCLDTLAGRPRYKPFPKWIAEQPAVTAVDAEGIASLYGRYEEEYGVGRNLRTLFRNLPDPAKDWLAANVAVQRVDLAMAAETLDSDKLVERLYRYFYDVRRNKFTHGAVSFPTPVAEEITEAAPEGWWIGLPSGADWHLSCREGLDEATILRMIIHAIGLQVLQIDLTSGLIEANLRNHCRIDALYAFVSEVHRNSALVNAWRELDHPAMGELHSYTFHVGVSLLGCDAARRMVQRYLDNTLESGLRAMTRQYLHYIDEVNGAIRDFNQDNPRPTKGQDPKERCRVINDFLQELVEKPECKSVAVWPSRTEMTNLWLVIRDPCYT